MWTPYSQFPKPHALHYGHALAVGGPPFPLPRRWPNTGRATIGLALLLPRLCAGIGSVRGSTHLQPAMATQLRFRSALALVTGLRGPLQGRVGVPSDFAAAPISGPWSEFD